MRRLTDGQLWELLLLETASQPTTPGRARAQSVLVTRKLAEGFVDGRADRCRITDAGRERLQWERETNPAREPYLRKKHAI